MQVLSTISHKIRYPNCVLSYFAADRYLDEIPVLAAQWLPIVKRPSRKRIVIRKKLWLVRYKIKKLHFI